MRLHKKIAHWLETHWVTPAYSGWVMTGLTLFFFFAATNTMAGWLYAISGVMGALLALGALLPGRSLRSLKISRRAINPVSVGDVLRLGMTIENQSRQPITLVQVQDRLPQVFGDMPLVAIEQIPALADYQWQYELTPERRGVYHWQTVELRTAAPLGLFWCQRSRAEKAIAIVYPTVLPLSQCPLIDAMGRSLNPSLQNDFHARNSTEGVTRTLRPYRWGDPTRLVHWRSSARYGELRVRELETFTGGQEVAIALDSASYWNPESFEQAVVAAASLYFYAVRRGLQVSLWTARTGKLWGEQAVLEALAAVQANDSTSNSPPPQLPLVWLTQTPQTLETLPPDSRWLLWQSSTISASFEGRCIDSETPLLQQLQAHL